MHFYIKLKMPEVINLLAFFNGGKSSKPPVKSLNVI